MLSPEKGAIQDLIRLSEKVLDALFYLWSVLSPQYVLWAFVRQTWDVRQCISLLSIQSLVDSNGTTGGGINEPEQGTQCFNVGVLGNVENRSDFIVI